MTNLESPIRITIVTPSFNQGEFLEETINSVICQNYPNLEYIVVDGASSDNSLDILDRYSDKINHCISEPDRGHWEALSKGFSLSTGEVMGWINSDDKLTPWSLECVSQIFTKFSHVNWIQGLPSRWNSIGCMTEVGSSIKNIYDFLNGDYQWIQQESVFWRRSIWESAGARISDQHPFMIDGELWSRFFLHDKLYSVGCILGGYRFHGANRALNYAEDCRQEMNAILSDLRLKASPDILNVARNLSLAKKLCRLPVFKATRTSKLVWKVLAKSLIRKSASIASYPSIVWDYDTNTWKETDIPFGL
jgi:glycosyltransferase involved in cell wall biosynthesis